ncbi:hypothetical protein BSKO_03269 [Bryopsis sp. KO-2023]|nr:hypothetical protein BSKO_03269 [Bryopsis sp. KO-2023]
MRMFAVFAILVFAALQSPALGIPSHETCSRNMIDTFDSTPYDFARKMLACQVKGKADEECCSMTKSVFGSGGVLNECLCAPEFYSMVLASVPNAGFMPEYTTDMWKQCGVPVSGSNKCHGTESAPQIVNHGVLKKALAAKALIGKALKKGALGAKAFSGQQGGGKKNKKEKTEEPVPDQAQQVEQETHYLVVHEGYAEPAPQEPEVVEVPVPGPPVEVPVPANVLKSEVFGFKVLRVVLEENLLIPMPRVALEEISSILMLRVVLEVILSIPTPRVVLEVILLIPMLRVEISSIPMPRVVLEENLLIPMPRVALGEFLSIPMLRVVPLGENLLIPTPRVVPLGENSSIPMLRVVLEVISLIPMPKVVLVEISLILMHRVVLPMAWGASCDFCRRMEHLIKYSNMRRFFFSSIT